ncbi:hypothetical protein [Streptomyces sp. TLI_053]|uniref:hypothetical protein n=1 Tax=Streptomyces sp. TLI_053 TaxID=1855352 RepID=UPI000A4F1910|nr:hypothetical protein [Streptomyces sp. TLI_053]
MKLSSWRVALRIARRDALRAKGRSALVVAMVALPVLGVAGADVVFRSAELDPVEKVVRTMGQSSADLRILDRGAVVLQAPDPEEDFRVTDAGETKKENGQPAYTPNSGSASTPSPPTSPVGCCPAPPWCRTARVPSPPPAPPRASPTSGSPRPTSPTPSGAAATTSSRAVPPAPTTRWPSARSS